MRALRRSQTQAERVAWHLLRGRRVGAKFWRQSRIDRWVVDFYCFEHRLAIELDGGVHSQPSQIRKDAVKEACLKRARIRLLRIPNGMVLDDPEEFLRKVRQAAGRLNDPSPGLLRRPPSPEGEAN
ncbi:MAG: endonuclease domain-containing protein [Terriglobia bacterium]